MATELDFLRDQNQRLSTVLRQHQMENLSKYSPEQKAVLQGYGDDTLEATMADRSFLAPLIVEYDKHLEEVNGQLKYYQIQVGEMKLQLENVTKENERLHGELKEAVEKQLESLPFGTLLGTDVFTDEEMCRNLQEQLQLANQEKNQAVELWQTVSQELDRLQKLYQDHITDAQIYVVERQKQKDRLTNLKQLTQQLHVANENIEMTNQQFLKTVTEQTVEIEQLRKQLRQAKLDLRVATAKVGEMTRLVEDLQGQIQKKVEDMEVAQGREEASDRRLYQLQSSIKQLEARLCVAVQEAEQLRTEKTNLEKQMKELHIEFTDLENEKYEAVVRARNSMQLLEEANLQKNQALLEEKQKEEDIEKMKETLSRLLQETAVQTRKEVSNTRKQCNLQISQLIEELSALQMECGDKQGQIEQVIREKRAVEEELEKVYREHRGNEDDYRKLEEMHQRCLIAERNKDDLQLRLKAAQNRIKQLEIRSELNRQKLHTLELLSQLETANEKVVENEKIIMEHQEKNNRLQRRLSQAEQRAASASQQLSVITVQRRKAASMMDLENI
ncbi:sodium channel and clathrin linker 1 isoform X7 [Petaurus breviceps papuanus]|uniref:sodium channel and clathrin linker 1 isoform X7 n=1 Tax=Petaurus breviceps papuanus TaxID=3040969 RepID=UPI0036D775CD